MNQGDLLRPAEVAALLSVHPQTLRLWDRQGRLVPIRLPSGQRRYRRAEVEALLGRSPVTRDRRDCAVYARVSTQKQAQAGNLERQRERLLAYAAHEGYHVVIEATDVASGLNQHRRGLGRLIGEAEKRQFAYLLIEDPDRLARFGYVYLVEWFRVMGVQVVVASAKEPEDASTELVHDMLAIVTSFSARLYGARGGRRVRERVAKVLAEVSERGGEG